MKYLRLNYPIYLKFHDTIDFYDIYIFSNVFLEYYMVREGLLLLTTIVIASIVIILIVLIMTVVTTSKGLSI